MPNFSDFAIEYVAERILDEAIEVFCEAGKPPYDATDRAIFRMVSAFERGGFEKMLSATQGRMKAITNPRKMEGLVDALKHVIDTGEGINDEQKKKLGGLLKLAQKKAKALDQAESRDYSSALGAFIGEQGSDSGQKVVLLTKELRTPVSKKLARDSKVKKALGMLRIAIEDFAQKASKDGEESVDSAYLSQLAAMMLVRVESAEEE